MKKLIILIMVSLCVCSLAGCAGNTKDSNTNPTVAQGASSNGDQTQNATQQESTEQKTTAAAGVNKLSLYINNKDSGYREISTGYNSVWEKGKDIVSFEAYATDEKSFTFGGSNFKNVWQNYWSQFPEHEKSKIGYIVEFDLKDGQKIKQTITGPNDVFGYRDYLECYLYDDVNQIQGNWYSHLLDTQVTEDTVMTSIKFTAGVNMEQMQDTIKLTAFVYNSDKDFDASGNYTGQVSYSVVVKNAAN